LNCARIGFAVLRFFRLEGILKLFGKRSRLLYSLVKKSFKYTPKKKKGTAVYFAGCFNKYLNSETKEAVYKILEKTDIGLIEPDFECCGVSYLYEGYEEKFLELLDKNLSKFGSGFDYVLTDCASCMDVLKQYKNYSDAAEEVSKKVISVAELLKDVGFEARTNVRVAVHVPCHEESDIVQLVKNIKNIEYVEAEDFDECCGFSGKFALKHHEISKEISKRKAQKYIETNADFVLTTCPACLLGLNQGMLETDSPVKPEVMNLFIFLAKYC
jgi:glycolate oxidase iron-sulfur subunit